MRALSGSHAVFSAGENRGLAEGEGRIGKPDARAAAELGDGQKQRAVCERVPQELCRRWRAGQNQFKPKLIESAVSILPMAV